MEYSLTFAKLDKKLQAIPEGPAAALSTPPWLAMWNAVGTVGILAGLLPSLLIKFMTPVAWMAFMAQMGIWIALVGYAPYFVRRDRKSTRLNSSHPSKSRMPSSA